jgi:spermidine synthase
VIDSKHWFTEITDYAGFAFSLKVSQQLHSEHSDYQQIDIYDTETFGRLMVIDGCIMLSARDNFIYHEMMSHPALFAHPSPKRVLIIGGGDCGTLREVLKHPEVTQAQQVDIDERVTRVAEKYFPELCSANGDPRAALAFTDGIAWVRQAVAGSYDVIIVDSTDPIGPGEILFTTEFYTHCQRALGEHGLFVQQSESPLIHHEAIIQPMQQRLLEAGFGRSRQLLFPQCTYPSGWWSCTLATRAADLDQCRLAPGTVPDFATRYYTADIHRAAAALPRFMTAIN